MVTVKLDSSTLYLHIKYLEKPAVLEKYIRTAVSKLSTQNLSSPCPWNETGAMSLLSGFAPAF